MKRFFIPVGMLTLLLWLLFPRLVPAQCYLLKWTEADLPENLYTEFAWNIYSKPDSTRIQYEVIEGAHGIVVDVYTYPEAATAQAAWTQMKSAALDHGFEWELIQDATGYLELGAWVNDFSGYYYRLDILSYYRDCVIHLLTRDCQVGGYFGTCHGDAYMPHSQIRATHLQVLDDVKALIDRKCGETGEVILELTYPAGVSPKVFMKGWVFGARCTADGEDLSDQVRWSGTAVFSPDQGSRSHPAFKVLGSNTIELSVEIGEKEYKKEYSVSTVRPEAYAKVGDIVLSPTIIGGATTRVCTPILTGSSTVTVLGLPAARVGDTGIFPGDLDGSFEIATGDPEVLIDGRAAARILTDTTTGTYGEGTIAGGSGLFDSESGQLRLPSVEIVESYMDPPPFLEPLLQIPEEKSLFSVEFQISGTDPITFTVNSAEGWYGKADPATFNLLTNRLYIPFLYLDAPGGFYWAEFLLIDRDPMRFELTGFGEN
jgi:uncharacterized Zn-binding protein involved in type VI secretion